MLRNMPAMVLMVAVLVMSPHVTGAEQRSLAGDEIDRITGAKGTLNTTTSVTCLRAKLNGGKRITIP